jgi:REP element-mobilizing transposase RayT
MARGNRRERIYRDDDDRRFFLKTLGEACGQTGWRVHAWVLMSNHYHLVLETPEPNLVAGMQWLQNAYTRRFNTRHRLWGRLFGDRYKAVIVEGGGYYYETLLDYVHLNPVRAGLVRAGRGQGVLEYPWSSVAGGHALLPGRRPDWLATQEALQAFGFTDTVAGRRRWVERLDERARSEERERCGVPAAEAERDARRSDLLRGWYWGSEAFAEQMLQWAEKLLRRPRHRSAKSSPEKQAHGEQTARRLLTEGLVAAGLGAKEVARLPGSDPRKVAIATVIWEQTTVNMRWLAAELHLRSPANASQQIRRYRQQQPTVPKPLQQWLRQSRNVA